jgi:two-component system, LytTR family, sensor kinase
MPRARAASTVTPGFWTFQIAGWLAFGAAMGLSRIARYPLGYMLATKTVLMVLGFAITLGLRALYRPLLAREPSLGRLILVATVVSYAAALAWTALYNIGDAAVYEWYFGRPLRNVTLTGGALYHAFVLVAWSVLYVGAREHVQLQVERERALRAEALASGARLQALRYQINPHFLFNTLNAVSTLVVERQTSEATRMIARLSDFLRLTLNERTGDEVPLAEELDFVQRYLDIEQVRFGERLRLDVAVGSDAHDAMVPVLLLQPLVENAVKHGVAAREEGGRIAVRAERDGATLRIVVSDDGPGPGAPGGGRGIGLANTRERLRTLYGDAQRLQLVASPDGGTRVVVELPFRAHAPGSSAPVAPTLSPTGSVPARA